MAAESFIGLSSMENGIKMLSSEKQIIENERHNFKMSVADMEKDREVHSNELKDTIDQCTILSSEHEKAILSENEVHTILAENQKLKNNNLMLLAELSSCYAKIAALHEEKDAILLDLQASQASVRNLEIVVEKKNENISSLQQANDELQKTICTLTEETEQAKAKLHEELKAMDKQLVEVRRSLHAKIAALHEENDITLVELQTSHAFVKNFESVIKKQNENISSLQQANDELQKTIYTLTEKLEQVKAKLQEEVKSMEKQLVEVRRSLHAKIAALHEEKDATLLELQTSQASIRNFESVVEKQNENMLSLQHANDELQKVICTLTIEFEQAKVKLQEEVKAMDKQLVEVKRSLHAKIVILHEEKDATLIELQASQASVRNFESMVTKQNQNISSLRHANDEVQTTICTLTEESKQAKAKLHEEVMAMDKQLVEVRRSLHAKIATLHEEKDATLMELQASKASIRNFESVVKKQNENISSLQQANDELHTTICTLTKESKQAKAKLQEEVKGMEKQLVEVRRSLHAKITALLEEKDATLLQLQASQASIKNFESVIEKQNKSISSLQQGNDELQKAICALTEELEQTKAKLQEEVKAVDKQLVEVRRSLYAKIVALHEEKNAALLELQASQTSVRNFETVLEKQNKSFPSLQQANDEYQKTIYTLTKKSEQTKARLQEEVKATDKQLVEMRRSLHAKIAALHEEKDVVLLELHASQASIRNFESVVEKKNEDISSLQQANDVLQKTICSLTEESEQAKAKWQVEVEAMHKQLVEVRSNLHTKIAVLHEENDATLSELHTSQASIRNFESVVEKQNENILSLQQANDELQKTICTLTEFEQANAKLQEKVKAMDKQLVEVRRSLHAKIASLHEEKDAALLELQASQASVRNFESVVEKQNKSILSLQQANDELQKAICTLTEKSEQTMARLQEEVKAMDKQLVEMRRSLHAKIATLHEEKDAALLDLQASQACVRNFESVVEKQNENNSSLQQANDVLQKTIYTLTKDSEQAKAKWQVKVEAMDKQLVEVRRSLRAKIVALHEEKNATLLELRTSQASIVNFESVVERQNENMSSLQQANDVLQMTICTLTVEFEQAKAKLQEEVKVLDKQLVELRRSLHAKIAALHEEKDATLLELQTSQTSVRNFDSVVKNQNENISSLQQVNDEMQKTICTLTEESEQVKAKLQEDVKAMDKQLVEVKTSLDVKIAALHEEKDVALLELQASQAFVKNFDSVVKKKNEKISSLQQANDELQTTICTLTEESEQAKAKLQEEVKAMDKQLVEVKRSLHTKIVALHEEKDTALEELQVSQASIRNFETVLEKKNMSISSQQQANDELQKTICTLTEKSEQTKARLQEEVKAMDKQLVEIRRSLHAKIAALHKEKDAVLLELRASQAFVRNFESVVEKQNENISSLQQANDVFQKTICTLTEESEQAKAKWQVEVEAMGKQLVEVRRSLYAKIAVLHEERDATILESQTSQASIKYLESVVEKQNTNILSLQQANDELQKARCTLTELEQAKAKLQEKVKAMDRQLVEVRRSLHAKIVALHEEKDATILELQASQASVRNFESVIEKQNNSILSIQQANDELQKAIRTLTEKSEQTKAMLQEEVKAIDKQLVEVRRSLHAKIATLHEEKDAALLELQASQASIRNFETVVEKQNKSILSQQQANDELQKAICTLTDKSEQTKARLQEEVKAMDKQLVEMRRNLHAKIAALHKEKNAVLLELQASQASVRNFKSVVEKQHDNISSLQQANDVFQKTICTLTEESELAKAKWQMEVESMDKQLVEVRRSLHAKITALHEEKDATLLELQTSQASIRKFESVVERQNENVSSLQQANDVLQKAICTLTAEFKQAKAMLQAEVKAMDKQLLEVRRSLHAKITELHEEKNASLLELQASHASVKNFDCVVKKQNENISSLQQANDELLTTICTLTEESEQAKAMLQDEVKAVDKQLVEVRRSLHAKIAALHENKDAALLELQASQASVRNFVSVIEKQNKSISSLQQANDELQKAICTLTEKSEQTKARLQEEVKAMDKQLVEMRRSHRAKITTLHEEKDTALLKLQASQASVKNIESVLEKQSEKITSLQQVKNVLQKNICTLTEQSEQAMTKLQEEVKGTQEEKDTVITRLKQSEIIIENLENEVARLIKELSIQLENNSTLDRQLEEATLKVSSLSEKLEKFQAEMAIHIDDMSLKTKELENTINVLSSEKTKVEEDLKILVEACSGNMSLMKEFEDTIKQRITDDVTRLGPLYQSLGEVLTCCQKLQYAYDEMYARASQLEVLKENQMEQIDKIDQLKEEKLNTFMENTKLRKYVQDLEFQLQHVKQKLMENKWKEDRFATTLQTSQAEIHNLEQLVSLLEETLEEVKEHAESGVLSLAEQLDKLESSFSQGFPRFVYRSSASSEEIKVVRKKLHDHLDQQKEHLKKKNELAIRLRNKEKVLSELVKNDAEARNLEKEVEEKEGGERTNNTTIFSKRWPILRRRKWRRNSYSC